MFTFITQLGVFGLDYDKVSEYFEVATAEATVTYAEYIEFAALLRGEKVSVNLIESLVDNIGSFGTFAIYTARQFKGRNIVIQCQDMLITPIYTLETLSRHFTLFRDFFDDYPNAEVINVPSLQSQEVRDIIDVFYPSELLSTQPRTQAQRLPSAHSEQAQYLTTVPVQTSQV